MQIAVKNKRSNSSTGRHSEGAFFARSKEPAFFNDKQPKSSFFPGVQPKKEVSQASEPKEVEAEKVADQVMRAPVTKAVNPTRVSNNTIPSLADLHLFPVKNEEEKDQKTAIQKRAELGPASYAAAPKGRAPPAKEQPKDNLKLSASTGFSMPEALKLEMEARFGANFNLVKIHTDTHAQNMSGQIHAQAFAYGNHIYFAANKYSPETEKGKHLLAHELTHTIQQGSAAQEYPGLTAESLTGRAPPQISRLMEPQIQRAGDEGDSMVSSIRNYASVGFDTAIQGLRTKASAAVRQAPGYKAMTVVLGNDPLTGEQIEANGQNMLVAAIDLIPQGNLLQQKLMELGLWESAVIWVNTQMKGLAAITAGINVLLQAITEKIRLINYISTDVFDQLEAVLNKLLNGIKTILDSLINYIIGFGTALLGIVKDLLVNHLAVFIKTKTPVYPLLTIILGQDPLTQQVVEVNGNNILNALLDLAGEEGQLQRAQMLETGTFSQVVKYIDEGILVFADAYAGLVGGFHQIWDLLTISSLLDLPGLFELVFATFNPVLSKVINFMKDVGSAILRYIKTVFKGRLAQWANTVPGYSLVPLLIGRDPFTGEVVIPTTEAVIHGFFTLIEGGEQQYQQLFESGAITKTAKQIDAALATLNMTPAYVLSLFTSVWDSFVLTDFIDPFGAFQRILDQFGVPLGKIFSFVVEVVKIVIEGVLAIMEFPVDIIGQIISGAMQAFEMVKSDPVGFLKNLLNAIKQGFIQFFTNIIPHLTNGLVGWLTAELAKAGVPPLTDLSFPGIMSWVLDLLGISMEKIWEKLSLHPKVGPERVNKIRSMMDTLEGAWSFIKDVQERGIIAIWDRIADKLSNLWESILDSVKSWVMETIVNKMWTKLLGLLDPTGIMTVINSVIALYRAVQSFIRYIREMLTILNSFVQGIVEIAAGNITVAANYVEKSMSEAVPVVIGFLANQLGLENVSVEIGNLLGQAREWVDEAITWLVNKVVDTGFALLEKLMAFGKSAKEAVLNWLGFRKDFKDKNGESHSLYLEAAGSSAVLFVASAPKRIEELISEKRHFHEHLNGDPSSEDNVRMIDDLDLLKSKNEELKPAIHNYSIRLDAKEKDAGRATYRRTLEGDQDAINMILNCMKKLLINVGVREGEHTLVDTEIKVEESGASGTKTITAEPLTVYPGKHMGTEPSEDPVGWNHITSKNTDDTKRWVRAHLINRRLHGPGKRWNLVNGTSQTNRLMSSQIEEYAINRVRENPQTQHYYEARVKYYENEMAKEHLEYFPSEITIDFGELTRDKKKFSRTKKLRKKDFPQGKPDITRLTGETFDRSTAPALYKKSQALGLQIPLKLFIDIVRVRKHNLGQGFGSDINILITLMRTHYQGAPKSIAWFNNREQPLRELAKIIPMSD